MDQISQNNLVLGPIREGIFQYILIGNSYKYDLNCYNAFFYNFPIHYPWRISYIIQFILDDLDPTLVDHLNHYLSACPIKYSLWPSMSCSSQDSTFQGFFSHKCGQKVNCRVFNTVTAAFPQIFHSFHSSSTFIMHIPLNGIS